MTSRPSSRSGFTLTEMLIVIWTLSVCLGFGVIMVLAALRTDQVGAVTLRELSRRAELADRFRADVAAADAAPERLGEWAAGPDCLILHTAAGHVVYRSDAGKLFRVVRTGDTETRTPLLLEGDRWRVEFVRPAGDRDLATLRIVESLARGVTRRAELSAALGGDGR